MAAWTIMLVGLVCAVPIGAFAQSLAAVAEQSSNRAASTTRTYTNADLVPVSDAAVPATPAVPETAIPEPAGAAKPAPSAVPKGVVEEYAGAGRVNVVSRVEKSNSSENEPFWRKVTKSVKDRLATAEGQLALVTNRLQTAEGRDRDSLVALESKIRRDMEFITAEFEGHKKRAKALGVPDDWLR